MFVISSERTVTMEQWSDLRARQTPKQKFKKKETERDARHSKCVSTASVVQLFERSQRKYCKTQ
jgi:hypothetical protein